MSGQVRIKSGYEVESLLFDKRPNETRSPASFCASLDSLAGPTPYMINAGYFDVS